MYSLLEFQFGTNWAQFSRAAGSVIGQTLAMEGVFSFFLESTFLGLYLFGEKKLGRIGHWWSAFFVFLGSWMSGYLIVATDAWIQHPTGYRITSTGAIELASFWGLLLNPWALFQYAHNMLGAVQTGCFVMAAVGSFYLLAKRDEVYGRTFVRIGVIVGTKAREEGADMNELFGAIPKAGQSRRNATKVYSGRGGRHSYEIMWVLGRILPVTRLITTSSCRAGDLSAGWILVEVSNDSLVLMYRGCCQECVFMLQRLRFLLSGVRGPGNFLLHLVFLPATFFLSGEGFGVVADVVGSTTIERAVVNLLPYPSLPCHDWRLAVSASARTVGDHFSSCP